jgi:LysM repeat protein
MEKFDKFLREPTTGLNRRQFILGLSSMVALSMVSPLALDAAIYRQHKVRKGENLTKIAKRYGVTVKELQELNRIKGSLIYAGQSLKIPSASGVLGEVKGVTDGVKVNKSKWKYIVAHHSATSQGSASSFDKVDRRHGMKNGLAYHFVIGNGNGSPDGEIQIGGRWKRQLHGGHVSKWEFNNHGIGVCLVGNFEKTRPTRKQMDSFKKLVGFLGEDLLSGRYKFYVHKQINATLCPGRYFPTQSMQRLFS